MGYDEIFGFSISDAENGLKYFKNTYGFDWFSKYLQLQGFIRLLVRLDVDTLKEGFC